MSDGMKISGEKITDIFKREGGVGSAKNSDRARVAAFIFSIKINGVTKDTANNYLEDFARDKSAEWLEKNIWSKLDMKTLVDLQKAVEEMGKLRIDGCFGGKSTKECGYELAGYIRNQEEKAENAKQYAKLPDKMKVYDKNKDGMITGDEVDDLKKFAADIKSLGAQDRQAVLEQTSPGLRLALLEMLFETRNNKVKVLPKPYPGGKEKPNKTEMTPLDSKTIKIIKEKMDKDSKPSKEIEKE